MKRIVIAVVLLASLLAAAQTKRLFHISQVSYTEFNARCDTGKPVADMQGSVLHVVCK